MKFLLFSWMECQKGSFLTEPGFRTCKFLPVCYNTLRHKPERFLTKGDL